MKTNTIYSIAGLTCNNCVAKVHKTLAPFADTIEVTLNPPQVKLTGQKVDINTLNNALKNVGNYQMSAEINENLGTAIASATLASYKPLILVFAYILLVTLAVEITSGTFQLGRFMPNFMAGFFLIFSFFKLLDLAGFASSYAMYDLLAKRLPSYGYIYPFIELGLGILYLLGYRPMLVNMITFVVMVFSSIGVIIAVTNKQKIRCACLGTGFNLPMTTVTIIEDVLMAAMAAWVLF